jgi:hypothetical protein
MARKITLTDLQRVVTAEGTTAPGQYSEQEYAGRLWLRLGGIDPDAVPVPPEDAIDARALEKAREVVARRYAASSPQAAEIVTGQLEVWRDQLNGR